MAYVQDLTVGGTGESTPLYSGTITASYSSINVDRDLPFALTNWTITWSFSYSEFGSTYDKIVALASGTKGIHYGIYSYVNGTLTRLVRLNSEETATNCSISCTSANYLGGGRKVTYHGYTYYQKSWAHTSISKYTSGTTIAENYPSTCDGSLIFSNIQIPTNYLSVWQHFIYFGFEDEYGNVLDTKYIGYIYVLNYVVKTITLDTSNTQTIFYKNGSFNYNGLVVNANYYYAVSDTFVKTETVSGYSVTTPSLTSAGSKTITVTYSSKTATYTITAREVTSDNYSAPSKVYFKYDEALSGYPSTIRCYYGSDSTDYSDCVVTASGYNAKSVDNPQVITLSYTATKTGETITHNYIVQVYPLYKLTINTTAVTKSFVYGQALSTSGLTGTAYFGDSSDDDKAGTLSVSANELLVDDYDNTIVGEQTLTVSYSYGNVTKTATYNVYVNGISDIKADISSKEGYVSSENKLRLTKNSVFSVSGIKVYVKRFNNGTTSDWVEYSGLITPHYDSDLTSTTGNKVVSLSITEGNQTISASFNVTVYDYTDLSLTNAPIKAYIVGGVNPTLSLGTLQVSATTSDGESETLTLNASTKGYTVDPLVGTTLVEGTNTITITSTLGLQEQFTIQVEDNHPTEDATIIVEGSLINNVYDHGETVNLNGISVKCKMVSDNQLHDVAYTATIQGKNSLTFTNNDTEGYYNIIITVDGIESSYTISNAVILDGIESVTDIVISKSTYKAGEFFDATTISGVVNFYASASRALATSDIANYRTTKFLASEVGTCNITFTACGFNKSVNVNVVKVSSLVVTNTQSNYNIYNALDTSKISVEVYYSDNTTHNSLDISKISFSFVGGTGCDMSSLIPSSNRTSDVVTATLSYTEEGETVNESITLHVKALKELKLYNSDSQEVNFFTYEYGEQFSLVSHTLRATYNDSTHEDIVLTNSYSNCYPTQDSRIQSTSVINGWVGYTFSNETITLPLSIYCHYLSDITVNFGNLSTADLYENDSLDTTQISATRTIASTNTNESGYPITTAITDFNIKFNNQNVNENFRLPSARNTTYRLEVSYTLNNITISKYIDVYVNSVVLQSVALTFGQSFKPFADYVEEQSLDLSGLTITLHYNKSASDREILYSDPNILIVDSNGDSVSKTKEVNPTDDNGRTLYVKYTENSVTRTAEIGTLTVIAKALSSIALHEDSGHITTFTYGDTFSISGATVIATFNSGKSEILNNSDLVVSGITSNHEFNPDDDVLGTQNVTLSYTYPAIGGITRSLTYSISVIAPKIASIRSNANDSSRPVKIQYKDGDTFSTSGLVLTVTCENGYVMTQSSNIVTDAVTVLNLDNDNKIQLTGNYGSKTITCSYVNPYDATDTITVTYNVEVTTSGAIASATKKLLPEEDYESYFVGDYYDAHGVIFEVTDVDGNVWESTPTATSITLGTKLRSAQRISVTVSYTNGSYSTSFVYDIIVSIRNSTDLTSTNEYVIAIGDDNNTLFTEIDHEEATIKLGVQSNGNAFYPIFHKDLVQVDDNPLHTNTYGYNIYIGEDAESDCIGYMDMGYAEGGTIVRQAHLILFDDPINPIDGDGNIIVTFPHYVEGYADRINKSHFGIVYNNRLFVSGNADYKNMDWHSGAINEGQIDDDYDMNSDGDFSYFSDLDYCRYGSEDTAIVGYDIYRDGDLIVVKEGSRSEATLYRRSYELVTATSYDGNTVSSDDDLAEEVFPMYDINANGGDGGLSHRSIVNFVGETLILTKNGLKAVTSKEDIYNNAKYSADVSSYINPKIKYETLSNSHIFTFNQRIFLKTSRGIYVGEYALRNDDSEYEWYFLDNINADLFFEIDEELYFANDNGEISRFPYELLEYKDKERTFIGTGGAYLQIDEVNNSIIASADYKDKIIEGSPFHLITTYTVNGADVSSLIHASLGLFVNKQTRINSLNNAGFNQTLYIGEIDGDNNYIEIKPYNADSTIDEVRQAENKDLFYEGRVIYFDNIVGSGYSVKVNEGYTLKKVSTDTFDYKYQLLDSNNTVVNLIGVETCRLSFAVNDLSITYITQISDYGSSGAKEFKLLGDHNKILDLIYYNNENGQYSGVITNANNVKAHYITSPYSFGTLTNYKTIWLWTIANDTNLASYMDVGYLSSHKQGDYELTIKSSGGSKELNFSGFNFDKVQFTSNKLPHIYTKYRTVPCVGFMRFLFRNYESSNMVLTALQVVYTFGNYMKGVK